MRKPIQCSLAAGILLVAGVIWLGPVFLPPPVPAPSPPPSESNLPSAAVRPAREKDHVPIPPHAHIRVGGPAPVNAIAETVRHPGNASASAPEFGHSAPGNVPAAPQGRHTLPSADSAPADLWSREPGGLRGVRSATFRLPAELVPNAYTPPEQQTPPNPGNSPSLLRLQEMAQEEKTTEYFLSEPAPEVEQLIHELSPGKVEVGFLIRLPEDLPEFPNALILSQRIPPGWHLTAADPLAESWRERDRVLKWLFMDGDVREQLVTCLLERGPDGAADLEIDAWFNYRLADGSFVEGRPYLETRVESP